MVEDVFICSGETSLVVGGRMEDGRGGDGGDQVVDVGW